MINKFNRLTPLDCKHNLKPVYDPKSYAYRNRRDIECKPSHLQIVWNGSDVERPSTHMGMMGLEQRNNILNQFRFKLGHQNFSSALLNGALFVIHNHWLTNQYWKTEHKLPKHKRRQPQYHTWIEKFPLQFKQLDIALNNMFDLSKMRHNFKSPRGTYTCLTIIDINEKELETMAFDMIEKNSIQFNTKHRKWNSRHLLSMFTYISRKGWTQLNERRIDKIYYHFGGEIDRDIIWNQCRRWRGMNWL